jgi:FAD/FMN-containing dehydrogenase
VPSYEEKKQRLTEQLRNNASGIRLEKATSNLFRTREKSGGGRLDVRQLNQVLRVDTEKQTVEVEGMTTYERLVDACLVSECMPLVVPQLKSITIGGAVSGIVGARYGSPAA